MWKIVPLFLTWILLGILVWACGREGSQDPAISIDSEIRFQVPFAHITGLTATLSISRVGTFPMTINPDNTVSATVPGIPVGRHTFTVTYYANGVILAQASTEAQVIADQTITVVFESQDLDRNFDDDLDGWINLAEVLCGTDPLSQDSRCPSEDPRFALLVAGGSVQSASYTLHDAVGEAMEGGQSTGDLSTIRGGFQAYP